MYNSKIKHEISSNFLHNFKILDKEKHFFVAKLYIINFL